MCSVDQIPGGPAISYTKFTIHSAHTCTDSPMAKTFNLLQQMFLGSTCLCFTDQQTQEENMLGWPLLP